MYLSASKSLASAFTYGASMAAMTLALMSGSALAQNNKLVGYIPTYNGMVAVANATDFSKLTHVNLAFINPNSSGVVANGANPVCMENGLGGNVSASDIAYVVNKAHSAGVKVLVSFAGGAVPSCSGNWASLLQAGTRQTLVNNIVQFVNSANLDGVDIDIEGALLTSIDNAGNYTPFIQALKNSLPAGKLVTSATASYVGGMIPASSIPYFDFVNIMSYDAIGPNWGVPGSEHSPYANAASDINTWLARGLPKSKLVLGVPFYGYGFNGMPSDITFATIVNQYGAAAAQNDVIGNRCAGCAYITYNGIPTIRSKTQLAKQQGSGVMVWELSQDASGTNNLISIIRSELGAVTSSSSSSSSSAPAFSKLIQAESYSNMNGVQVENTTDIGGGQNVGWIDQGDWMAYANINFPTSGAYKVEYRVASISGSTLSLDLNAGSIQLGQVPVPATTGWQKWATVTHPTPVIINAGTYSVGIFAPAGGWNINWIKFTKL